MSKKTISVFIVLILMISAIGFRIHFVNANAVKLTTEHYQMGEWVDLNGAFFDTISENTDGYSIQVKSARLMSYNEFIIQHCDGSDTIEGLEENSVVDLEVEIKNEENENGYIFLFACNLVSEKKYYYLNFDQELWYKAEPKIIDSLAFSLMKDSVYTTHIPYTINAEDESYIQHKNPIKDRKFEMVLSNSPVRKVIDIQIQGS